MRIQNALLFYGRWDLMLTEIDSQHTICFNTGCMVSLGNDDVSIVRARKKEMARTTQKRKFPKGVCVL